MAILNPYQFQQSQKYQQYQQQQVFTAPPDKLLLMLYDGAIRFCNRAKKSLSEGQLEESHHYLLKAQDIMMELMTSLRMDFEFSENLYALYDFLYRQLVEVNLKKEPALLDEIIEILTELRQTWAEVALKVRETRKLVVGGGSLEG